MQSIHLNGGPLHDQHVAIPEGLKCFTITVPLRWPDQLDDIINQHYESVPTRTGHYSATTYRGEFEWDGWRPCSE
ncbi:hypothetical protein SEA_ENDOR_50 [Microbacterium phage Endor]|nr:hypothetical protein SEA_ENDOR_50 [Microbacterium phage Endor]